MKVYNSHISKIYRDAEMPLIDWLRMKDCDVVVMPIDWQTDRRCIEERYAALSLEKEVVYESRINNAYGTEAG